MDTLKKSLILFVASLIKMWVYSFTLRCGVYSFSFQSLWFAMTNIKWQKWLFCYFPASASRCFLIDSSLSHLECCLPQCKKLQRCSKEAARRRDIKAPRLTTSCLRVDILKYLALVKLPDDKFMHDPRRESSRTLLLICQECRIPSKLNG